VANYPVVTHGTNAMAIIHAQTTYVPQAGELRHARYTDIWAKRDGRWLAIAAHVTR